jgi:3-dehydroquinate synthase
MIAENALAVGRGLLSSATAMRIRALLARLGLPTRLSHALDAGAFRAALALDKKSVAGAVNYVLLSDAGRTVRVADVSDAEVAAAIAAING